MSEEKEYAVYTAKEHMLQYNAYTAAGKALMILIGERTKPLPRVAVGLIEEPAYIENVSGKSKREKHFPVELLKSSLRLTLETAKASVDADRIKILNTIADQPDLTAEPLEKDPKYDRLNAILRGRFAAIAIRVLLESGESIEEVASRLRASELKKLSFNFTGVQSFDASAMQLIASNLPPELTEFDLRDGVRDEHMPAIASAVAEPALKIENLRYATNPPLKRDLITQPHWLTHLFDSQYRIQFGI